MESSLFLWESVSIDYINRTHQMVDPMPVVSHSWNDVYTYIYIYIYLFIYIYIYLYIYIYM